MSELHYYDEYFSINIEKFDYAKIKKGLIRKELSGTDNGLKKIKLEQFLTNENSLLERFNNQLEEINKLNQELEEMDKISFTQEDKYFKAEVESVFKWLKSEQELYNQNDNDSINKNVKKGDLGSAQNLTYALITMIFKLESNDTIYDTSKLRDFIFTITGKSKENIEDYIVNYKRLFLHHLIDASSRDPNWDDRKKMITALKKPEKFSNQLV